MGVVLLGKVAVNFDTVSNSCWFVVNVNASCVFALIPVPAGTEDKHVSVDRPSVVLARMEDCAV